MNDYSNELCTELEQITNVIKDELVKVADAFKNANRDRDTAPEIVWIV